MRRRMTNEILICMFMAFLTDVRCIIPTEKQITVTFFHYYESWNRAQAICVALGGDLYREFSEERAIVLRVFRNLPEWFPDLERYAWIGVHALLEADGNLTWVYGMPTCNVIYPSSHIHWNPSDPSYGLQCATQYLVDAQWYTARCDWDFKHFICERTESTDCTFTETTGIPKLTISLDYKTQTSTHSNSASCRDSCLSSMYSNLNCWAATYEGTTCVLYYTSNPWLFTEPDNIDASSKQLFLKDCYISWIQCDSVGNPEDRVSLEENQLHISWNCQLSNKTLALSEVNTAHWAGRASPGTMEGMTDSTDDTPTSAVDSRTPDEGCTQAVSSTASTTTSTTTTSTTTTSTTTTTPTTTTTTPTTTTTTTPTTTTTSTPTTTTTSTTTTTPTTTSTTTPSSTSTTTSSTTSSTTSTSTTSTIPTTMTTSTTTATPTSTSTSTSEPPTTSSSTTSSSTSTSTSTTTSQADTNCSCSCADLTAFFRNFSMDPVFANLTTEEKLSIITKRLTLNKSLLSSTIRKKTSAEDNRPSSVSIGVVSIVFMALILGVLLTSDAINFCNQCSRKVGTTL